ncbi:hypothetical protein [Pectobacterium sp. A5351]|uniref:hypothetical protein n=1 Tax=Pectobacterium sp. A5351 TaxID=2914983 RepID=UPI00232DE0C1|nr:hypothetical protein [Pectobacterium sp. A5351]WCG82272.1 hypothetical protein O1Q74_15320 [Pectobacterium sp. A5351]
MLKAAYQDRFIAGQPVTFKPSSQQKKTLIKAAQKAGKKVGDYANYALVENLKEEDKL